MRSWQESGKLAANVFAPLNIVGDRTHAKLNDGVVTLPPGFAAAYKQYVEGGWAGLGVAESHGGQGLPFAVAVAVQEQLTSANMAFALVHDAQPGRHRGARGPRLAGTAGAVSAASSSAANGPAR